MQDTLYTATVNNRTDNSVSKSELRRRNTQNLIKNALYTLIEKQDFNKISVEDICAQANVVRKTFYNHFTDKRDVLQALYLDITLTDSASNTRRIITEYHSTADRIEALFRHQRERIEHYGIGRKKVLQAKILHSTPAGKYHELKQDFDESLQELFRSGQQAGDTSKSFSPKFLANIVYSALSNTTTQWIEDEQFNLEENEQLVCQYLKKVVKLESN